MLVHEKDAAKGSLMGFDAKVTAVIKKNEEEKRLALQKQQQEELKKHQAAAKKHQEQLEMAQMTAQFISQPQGSWVTPLQMRPPPHAAPVPMGPAQAPVMACIPPSATATTPAAPARPAALDMAMWEQFQQFQRFLALSQSMSS